MRARTALLGIAVLAAGCGGGGTTTAPATGPRPTPALKVTITASTHRPKVNAKWPYEVRAPGRGKITVKIVDPVGGVHPVQYDGTKRNVTGFPFRGSFRDYLEFPPDSKGYRLTVRATVTTASGTGHARYWVKSR